MSTPTIDLWPDESATCPCCQGIISKETPLRMKCEGPRRHEGAYTIRTAAEPQDRRPCCPHCEKVLNVVIHHAPRCQQCKRQAGPDGRTLGLVDGLCSRCHPDLVAALSVPKVPKPKAPALLYAVHHVGDPVPSIEEIKSRAWQALAEAEREDKLKMWFLIWMYSGWKRLYRKLDKAADQALKQPCEVCGGEGGSFDHTGWTDSGAKPWCTCSRCEGHKNRWYLTDRNLIARVVRLRDNAYIRLANAGWL